MKRLLPAIWLMAASPAVFAQTGVAVPTDGAAMPAPPNPVAIMPLQPAPASPATAANTPQPAASKLSNVFPELPPSRPCTHEDLWGYYGIEKLYEQPAGKESADFQAAQLQFLHFAADSTYRSVKLAGRAPSRKAFYDKFKRNEGDPLLQYVVHEGFLYFYNNGKPLETQACFIVANEQGEFKKGYLLLMPPAPQEGEVVSSRLLKVYKNFNRPRGKKPLPEALNR